MTRTIGAGALLLLAILLYVLYSAAFTVNEAQQALVLRFGDARRVIQQSGLHWKVPVADQVIYLDRRILDLDSPVQEVIASDQKRLVVDAFARYRISDPLRFYQSVGNLDDAESRLATVLNSSLRRVLGEETFFAVVRDERDALMNEITRQVNREAQSFGIDVVDVRIRRADLPQANSEAIYRRMQTEREQEAAQIRAEGEEQARRIRSRADREATVLVAEARREGEEVRGEGDARRNAIFADAYGRDPDFFDFYRSMQAYENGLRGERTRFVVTPESDFFRYFNRAAGLGVASGTESSSSGAAAPAEEGTSGPTPDTTSSADDASGTSTAAAPPEGGTTAPASPSASGESGEPASSELVPGLEDDGQAAATPAQ